MRMGFRPLVTLPVPLGAGINPIFSPIRPFINPFLSQTSSSYDDNPCSQTSNKSFDEKLHHRTPGKDDDDVVAAINVRGERSLVLAAQAVGDDGSQTTQNQALSVDQHPVLFHLSRLQRGGGASHGGGHENDPSSRQPIPAQQGAGYAASGRCGQANYVW